MAEELGKIERPSVDEFMEGRKLYFVPLVFAPRELEADLSERVDRYWDQVEAHLASLEGKLGGVKRVYHELVTAGGQDGAKVIEELNQGSYKIARSRLEKGAELQAMEDRELLAEFMDWGKCLAIGLESHKALTAVYEFYREAMRKRNEFMAKQINETLKSGETAILLMREGHQVQFPSDIQVFYVAPPALDDLKRWLREREAEAHKEHEAKAHREEEADAGGEEAEAGKEPEAEV